MFKRNKGNKKGKINTVNNKKTLKGRISSFFNDIKMMIKNPKDFSADRMDWKTWLITIIIVIILLLLLVDTISSIARGGGY